MFDSDAFAGHESIHHFYDEASGLKAIIAIHSTALGPGAGGCRMWNYDNAQAAMRDALRLYNGNVAKQAERRARIHTCETHWFFGTTALQPQVICSRGSKQVHAGIFVSVSL